MTRQQCLDFFSGLPFDGYLALDENGYIITARCPEGFEGENALAACVGKEIFHALSLETDGERGVSDWHGVLQNGVPSSARVTFGKYRLNLKPGKTGFFHPDGGSTVFLIFDRSIERYYQLLHRVKGHFHLLLGYFHLRERGAAEIGEESLPFLDARALTAVVSALGEAYRQATGETFHILPSAALLPLFESFSGRWNIVSSKNATAETPTPVRFVEKLAFWMHQVLILALKQFPKSPALFEMRNAPEGVSIALYCKDVDWNLVFNDDSASGELAQAYLSDLSGTMRVENETLHAHFSPPDPFLARI